MKAERPGAPAIQGLERLVDCGRSSVYGARRRAVFRGKEKEAEPSAAEALAAKAIALLNAPPRSSYALARRGTNCVAKKADAKAAARAALADADAAARGSKRCVLAWIAGAL